MMTMTTDEAKALVRYHFDQFVNRQNHDVVRQTLAANFVDHDGPNGGPANREGDRRMMEELHTRIPDLQVTIEDIIAEGDKVVCRNVWRGTKADGTPVEFKGIVIWRIDGSAITERWASVSMPRM